MDQFSKNLFKCDIMKSPMEKIKEMAKEEFDSEIEELGKTMNDMNNNLKEINSKLQKQNDLLDEMIKKIK